MLTADQNDRITRVGPGTPLGELMRRYWTPVAPASMLDENPVKKVKILGEELVLYRDRRGTIGLIKPRCGHRLVHMELGIPDEMGLRCPYHGWCYDETGQCVDTPLESPNSRLKERINIGGYPVRELGGLVFAYLGPAPAPELPRWDFLVQPNAVRQIGLTIIPCNWLQCHENSADPFHNTYLHGHMFKYALERKGVQDQRIADAGTHRATRSIDGTRGATHVIYEPATYGFRKAVVFSKERGADRDWTRYHSYNIFPYYSRGVGGMRTQVNMRVPLDDERTYHISYEVYHAPEVEAPTQESIPYFWAPMFDEDGQPIMDYVLAQDMFAWMAQGPITDRTQENLGMTDLAIIEWRKAIEEQIQRVERGEDPINFFRDPAAMPDKIELIPPIATSREQLARTTGKIGIARDNYHLGYYQDDVDRYGPAIDLAVDLMRRASDARAARAEQNGQGGSTPATGTEESTLSSTA